jgi:hypothetical protein
VRTAGCWPFHRGLGCGNYGNCSDAIWEKRALMMKKIGLLLLLVFVLGLVVFSTWQLFAGNLEAAFSTLPFLLITYLFVMRFRR